MGADTILITGGAGLIGSHLARALVDRGARVVLFDSFVPYAVPTESAYHFHLWERTKDLLGRCEIVRGDTTNSHDIARALEKHQPATVIHLAALPLADLASTYSEEAVKTILHGTVNVLEAMRDHPSTRRIVYASSSMVYGDFRYEPADEEHPCNPKDIYGGTKYAGEVLVRAFSSRFGYEHVVVRPIAVFGPGDANRRVIQVFIERAIQGQELLLHGGGEMRLDFTYVRDTAQGFMLAAQLPQAANQTFNIARGRAVSLLEVANCLRSHFPDLRTRVTEPDALRPKRGTLSIEKARSLLGYEPHYGLEEALAEYVPYTRRIARLRDQIRAL